VDLDGAIFEVVCILKNVKIEKKVTWASGISGEYSQVMGMVLAVSNKSLISSLLETQVGFNEEKSSEMTSREYLLLSSKLSLSLEVN
jgi:hypothetical protein